MDTTPQTLQLAGIGGYVRGCTETEITVRDGLPRRLRSQLAEFAATECPRAARDEGPAEARDARPCPRHP